MLSIWDDDHRKIAWLVILRMRYYSHTDVNPTISNAYVYIQKYFRANQTVNYDLYIILISSLLVAFKNEDLKCDIRSLFSIFLTSCNDFTQFFDADKIISIFNCGSLSKRSISSFEEAKVNTCEMDILEALDFETHTELPFDYFDSNLMQFVSSSDPSKFHVDSDVIQEIYKKFEIQVIKFFSAAEYLDLPVPVMAAITLSGAIKGKSVPEETVNWINEVKKNFGPEMFNNVFSILKRQNQLLYLPSRQNEKESTA